MALDSTNLDERVHAARDHARAREKSAAPKANSPDDRTRAAGLLEVGIYSSIAEVLDVMLGE